MPRGIVGASGRAQLERRQTLSARTADACVSAGLCVVVEGSPWAATRPPSLCGGPYRPRHAMVRAPDARRAHDGRTAKGATAKRGCVSGWAEAALDRALRRGGVRVGPRDAARQPSDCVWLITCKAFRLSAQMLRSSAESRKANTATRVRGFMTMP